MAGLPGKTVALGSPQSSTHQVSQPELADWMTEIEGLTGLSGFAFVRGSAAALSGLGSSGQYALVVTTSADRGIYERGASVWTKVADLPLILTESLAADQAEADRILAQAAAVSAEDDADAAAASATAAATSQSLADVARTQAQLAAVAAGATFYASVAAGEAGTINGDVFLVSTEPGVQVYENDTGAGVFLGWLGEVLLDDVTALKAWSPAPVNGTIIRTRREDFAYEADSTLTSSEVVGSTVKLRVLADSSGSVSIAQFGAVAGVGNIAATTTAMLNAVARFNKIFIPAGEYWCNKTLNAKRPVNLFGETGTHSANYPSKIVFEDGITGFFMHRNNTMADDTGVPFITGAPAGDATGWNVSHLEITTRSGNATVTDDTSHGLRANCRGHVHDCRIHGFGGDGIHINANIESTDPETAGNANNWHAARVRVNNCRDGIHANGSDVNVGCGMHLDLTANRRYGIYDRSFLGCSWINCTMQLNAEAAVEHVRQTGLSTFVGCYTEPGTGALWRVSRGATIVGGQFISVTVEDHPDSGGWSYTNISNAFVKVGRSLTTPEVISVSSETTVKMDQIWNIGSRSTARSAGLKMTVGNVGIEQDVARVRGTPGSNSGLSRGRLLFDVWDDTADEFQNAIFVRGETYRVLPGADDTWLLGDSGARWSQIFATNGTINTSDEREKQDIRDVSAAEIAVARRIRPRMFRWKSGNPAIHVGVIAQEVIAAFEAEGLNALEYGCVHECAETGRLGVRMDQILALMLSAMID